MTGSQAHNPVVTLLVPAALLPPPAVHQIPSTGITLSLVTLHANANPHALNLLRKMLRPVTSGKKCHWPSQSRLFLITDRTSKLGLLVDTGAEVSLLPLTHQQCMHLRQHTHMHSYRKHPPHEGFSLQLPTVPQSLLIWTPVTDT